MNELDALLVYCTSEGRVCPIPREWARIWQALPPRRTNDRASGGWEPASPLILAAWHHATDAQKRDRLREHILWAQDHDAYGKIDTMLRELAPEEWHYEKIVKGEQGPLFTDG